MHASHTARRNSEPGSESAHPPSVVACSHSRAPVASPSAISEQAAMDRAARIERLAALPRAPDRPRTYLVLLQCCILREHVLGLGAVPAQRADREKMRRAIRQTGQRWMSLRAPRSDRRAADVSLSSGFAFTHGQ